MFQCNHPSLTINGVHETTLHDCQSCPYKPRPAVAERKLMLLRFPHGLGDAVAFTAVLAHLAKHHPDWTLDMACDANYSPLFAGRVRQIIPFVLDATHVGYDQVFDLHWKEGQGNRDLWPSTKAVRCLLEDFQIHPEKELLRYVLSPGEEAKARAAAYLSRLPKKKGVVAVHYEGNACRDSKDIPVDAVARLCEHLIRAEYVPLLLDWQERPKLADNETIFCPGRGHMLWRGLDRAEPDVLAALLGMTALNVCIDSGPQKLAMTTRVPLLCVWHRSSPVHYVDCPDDMVQLVPADWEACLQHSNGVDRRCDRARAAAFFRGNYRWHAYHDLARGLCDMADFLLGTGTVKPTEPCEQKAVAPTGIPAPAAKGPRKLLLATGLPPGDATTLTAAVEMLHAQHPGRYLTAVETSCPALWEHNPHVVPADQTFERLQMEYHTVNESGNRPVHFIEGYTEFLAQSLGAPIRMTTNRPHLYLSNEEKAWMNQVWETTGSDAPYWIVNAGVKRDYTCKQYHAFQEVVDLLRDRVRFAQVGKDSDLHIPLRGVVNLLGKTSDRALIRLVYHAQGVLCGVTWLMHLAAAFEKPAVIVAGGREPRLWNSYPTMTLLATVGGAWAPEGCCRTGGCWKSRVVAQNDGKDGELCKRPMPTVPPVGECMTRISPLLVAETVRSYLP